MWQFRKSKFAYVCGQRRLNGVQPVTSLQKTSSKSAKSTNETAKTRSNNGLPSSKNKWKNNEILIDALHLSAITQQKRVEREEKRLTSMHS
jgi:hypothetical protein